MMEHQPIKTDSFDYIRDLYFNGNLKSGQEVIFDNVHVLKKTGKSIITLSDGGPNHMLATLDNVILESNILDNLKIGDEINLNGNYINSSPKQPSLYFTEQLQETEIIVIKDIINKD